MREVGIKQQQRFDKTCPLQHDMQNIPQSKISDEISANKVRYVDDDKHN